MKVRCFNRLPKAYLTYPAIIKGIFKNKKVSAEQIVFPDVSYEVAPCLVQPKHLVAYNEICGFKNDGYIPAIYFAMRAQILHMYMMTQENFPIAVMELIHDKNQVIQYQRLNANVAYKITCQFGNAVQTENGILIEFVSFIYEQDRIVAESKSTYLKPRHKDRFKYLNIKTQTIAQWRVTQSLIRRYASISGDFNVVHLHDLGAKAFGLDQAIAHGMWSQASMMARLNLPAYYDFTVSFNSPLYIGQDVVLSLSNSDNYLFDRQTHQIYVSGHLKT